MSTVSGLKKPGVWKTGLDIITGFLVREIGKRQTVMWKCA